MTTLNYLRQDLAYMIGGSISTIPSYFVIGSGSGTTNVAAGSLMHEVDRQLLSTTTYPTTNKVLLAGDWNSFEASGISLAEYGIAKAITGSIYSRTSFAPITFDGTNELRIEETWEVF